MTALELLAQLAKLDDLDIDIVLGHHELSHIVVKRLSYWGTNNIYYENVDAVVLRDNAYAYELERLKEL